jgi:hypothetical protein
MSNVRVRSHRLWRRLLGLTIAAAVVNQAAGCALDPQQALQQVATFAHDFALQVLAAYLL